MAAHSYFFTLFCVIRRAQPFVRANLFAFVPIGDLEHDALDKHRWCPLQYVFLFRVNRLRHP